MSKIDVIDSARGHSYKFLLWPQQWRIFPNTIPLTWGKFKFKRSEKDNIPDYEGVYGLILKPQTASGLDLAYLMYIGITERTLRERFMEYIREMEQDKGRPLINEFLLRYEPYIHFVCSPKPPSHDLKDVEDKLLETFIPPLNDQFPASINPLKKAFLGDKNARAETIFTIINSSP